MKTASSELAALINTGNFAPFDLYAFDLVGGGRLAMTAADFDIAYAGTLYSAQGARIGGSRPLAHWKTGLDVDQWQVTIAPRRRHDLTGEDFPDRIGSVPWLQAAAQGMLDGAAVTVARAYFGPQDRGIDIFGATDVFALEDAYAQDRVAVPMHPIPQGGAVPVGVLTMMRGTTAEVDVATTQAVLTINDARQILTTQMPRNVYQSGCRHRLFDGGCQLAAATFAQVRTVRAGSSRTYLAFTPGWAPVGAGYLDLGRVVFLTGGNAGVSRTIAGWDPNAAAVSLVSPLPSAPAVGDTIRLYPGCNKTMDSCSRFGNLLNYSGEPFVPVPETTS